MRSSAGPAAVGCLISVLLSLHPEPGQAQEWVVGLSAGHFVHDPLPAETRTTGATLGLRREGAPWIFAAAGVPFDSVGVPWGALGMGGRLATSRRRLTLGADLGAHGFGFHHRDSRTSGVGVTAEALPVLSLRVGSGGVQLRSGVVHHGATYGGEAEQRTLHYTDARAVLVARGLLLTGESRYLRAREGGYPYVGGAVESRFEGLRVWAFGGTWSTPLIETPAWGVGTDLRIRGRTEAHLSFQQESSDPLYWNAPRRSWNVGLSRRLGRQPRLPVPLPIAVRGEAGVTFSLPLSASASAPRLAGDFTGWRELPMVRNGDIWSISLPIPSGTYHYAFRDADGKWFVPDSTPGRVEDGFGGFNAVLIVP